MLEPRPSTRCPVCFSALTESPRPCADCGTPYHVACFQQSGCVVAGCAPGKRRAGPLTHSPIWRPATSASAIAVGLAILCLRPASGPEPLSGKILVSLAISCWCAGGGGVLIAGFQDLGWNIPSGGTVRPDRLGTMAAMALGLAMTLAGVGCAMRTVDVDNASISVMLCAGAAGLLLVGLAMAMLGTFFDEQKGRALKALVPMLIAGFAVAAEFSAGATRVNRHSEYPVLRRPGGR